MAPLAAGSCCVLWAVALAASETRLVPLTRREGKASMPRPYWTSPGALRGNGTPGLPLDLASTPLLRLADFFNTQYFGIIELGTPPQQVTVIFDSGSSDFWVKPEAFNMDLSSTWSPTGDTVSITYGMGTVVGDVGTEEMSISGVKMDTNMLVLTSEQGLGSVMSGGVLGLALPGLAHSRPTVLEGLTAQAGLHAYTLLLGSLERYSYLALGPPEPEWLEGEDITWAPVIGDLWWEFQGSILVGGRSVVLGQGMMLDSGTSYFAIPEDVYDIFLRTLLPPDFETRCTLWQPASGVYSCPCEAVAETKCLSVQVQGKNFDVMPDELYSRMIGDQCILQVMKASGMLPTILGDTFLRTVVSVYDAEHRRVGVAARTAGTPGNNGQAERVRSCRANADLPTPPMPVLVSPYNDEDQPPQWQLALVGALVGALAGWAGTKAYYYAADRCCAARGGQRVAPQEGGAPRGANEQASGQSYVTLA